MEQDLESQEARMVFASREEANKEVSELVEDYLEGSFNLLRLSGELKKRLNGCRKSFKPIQSEDFVHMFESVYEKQRKMLYQASDRKNELDRQLKQHLKWRKILLIVFISIYTAAAIFSIVVAAMTGSIAASMLTVSLWLAGQFFNLELKKYEKEVKRHRDLIVSIQATTKEAVEDLQILKSLVENVDDKMMMVKIAREAVEKDEEEIKQKVEDFKKMLDKLKNQIGMCTTNIEEGKIVVLERIH